MSFDFTSNANHLDAVTSPVVAPPFTMGGMFKSTPSQGRRFMTLHQRGVNTEFYALINDITATNTGKFGAYVGEGAKTPQQVLAGVMPTNIWVGADACFESTVTRSCMSAGGNKATSPVSVYSPAGINGVARSGRPSDHTFGIGGLSAHGYLYNRILQDVERKYLQLGGARRAIKSMLCYWKDNRQSAGVVPDELANCNLTITGTMAAGVDNPAMASWYSGPAIGAQVYQSGQTITSLPIGATVENVDSTLSYVLMRVGASTATTTATAPVATAARVIFVADVTIFASGDYASVGAGAKSRVLDTFTGIGTAGSIVVTEDQSYATGDTVTRYPAAASGIAGCTLSGTGTWNGTPSATQALTADYFFGIFNSAFTVNPRLRADTNLFPITVNAIPVAPVFSVPPTAVPSGTGGYLSNFATNTACTVYAGGYDIASADPSISQLKVGTGARAFTTKAVNGPDSIQLLGFDFPDSDLFFVLNNLLGDSPLFVIRAQRKAPPPGSVYRQFASVDPTSPYAGNVSVGDVEETSATLSPSGAAPAYFNDGNEAYTAAGRQRRTARTYNAAAGVWRLDSTAVQQYNFWYNNIAPKFIGGPSVAFVVPLGTPITPQTLVNLFQSIDGAQQVITALDALPAGLAVVANQVTGTATVAGVYVGKRLRSTDITGATGDGAVAWLVGPLHPPDCFSIDYREASALILANFLVPDVQYFDYDGPPNIVLSQDPGPTASVQPFSKVTINVTRTPAGAIPDYGLRDHSFTVTPQADGDLDLNHPDGSG